MLKSQVTNSRYDKSWPTSDDGIDWHLKTLTYDVLHCIGLAGASCSSSPAKSRICSGLGYELRPPQNRRECGCQWTASAGEIANLLFPYVSPLILRWSIPSRTNISCDALWWTGILLAIRNNAKLMLIILWAKLQSATARVEHRPQSMFFGSLLGIWTSLQIEDMVTQKIDPACRKKAQKEGSVQCHAAAPYRTKPAVGDDIWGSSWSWSGLPRDDSGSCT